MIRKAKETGESLEEQPLWKLGVGVEDWGCVSGKYVPAATGRESSLSLPAASSLRCS